LADRKQKGGGSHVIDHFVEAKKDNDTKDPYANNPTNNFSAMAKIEEHREIENTSPDFGSQ